RWTRDCSRVSSSSGPVEITPRRRDISTTIAIREAPPQRKKRAKELETHRAFAERHGVSTRTIDRWTRDGLLPKPIRINKRKYWNPSTQPRRDTETAAASNVRARAGTPA